MKLIVFIVNAYFTERVTGTILSALCFRLKLWEWHSLYVTHMLPSACLFLSDLFGRPDVVTNTQSQKHKTEWHPNTSARYESIWMETAQIWLQPFPGLTGTDTRTLNQYSLWSSFRGISSASNKPPVYCSTLSYPSIKTLFKSSLMHNKGLCSSCNKLV